MKNNFPIILVIALSALALFCVTFIRSDASKTVISSSSPPNPSRKEMRDLERAQRVLDAACKEARHRAMSGLLAFNIAETVPEKEQLSYRKQGYAVALEVSYWIKYCVERGFVAQQGIIAAVEQDDVVTVRKLLADFRADSIIVVEGPVQ